MGKNRLEAFSDGVIAMVSRLFHQVFEVPGIYLAPTRPRIFSLRWKFSSNKLDLPALVLNFRKMPTKGNPMSSRVLYNSPPPDLASPMPLPDGRFMPPGRPKTGTGSLATRWQVFAIVFLLVALPLVFPPSLAAQLRKTCPAPTENPQFSWVVAPLYSFPSRVNGGGTLSVFSLITGADVNKQVTRRLEAGLSFTYIYDDYNFSGLGGFPRAPHPWGAVNTAGVSVPLTYSLTDDCAWKLFVQPTLQFSGAVGAQFGESLTFGSIVAVSHVFSPNLELGMGLGVYYNLACDQCFSLSHSETEAQRAAAFFQSLRRRPGRARRG